MGFLIKSAFWLSLVLLLIPFGGEGSDDEASIGAVETFIAAQAVIGDVAGLCERRPDACEIGKSALHTIGVRAKEGARIAYGMLDEHFGEEQVAQPIHTGSIAAADGIAAPAPASLTEYPVPPAR
ncbi:DUF5330 domain-containing protein [Mesorhizobium sp. CAU 1741]|uniref:DUF5330 domain-containing protein n=1 Tax=Mesorhizobium sp. CAU 1741 TaxID=3140366 RepID=UPI00325AD79F